MTGTDSADPDTTLRLAGRSRPKRSVLRAARLPMALLIAGILAFAAGFGWFATHIGGLATPSNPAAADAIIVLTGGHQRLDAALDLLKSGKGRRLLISGVHPAADSDDIRAATGGDAALFDCCVDIDHAARDTIGNAEESAKWLDEHAYDSVLLVTNNYHMPRSMLELGRVISRTELRPYPVVNARLDGGGWLARPEALRVLFTEYNKYLLALVRGLMSGPSAPARVSAATAPAGG